MCLECTAVGHPLFPETALFLEREILHTYLSIEGNGQVQVSIDITRQEPHFLYGSDPTLWLNLACAARRLTLVSCESYDRLERHALE